MCIICVELEKNKLSPWEARQNIKEMSEKIDEKHLKEVEKKIFQLENENLFDFFVKNLKKGEK